MAAYLKGRLPLRRPLAAAAAVLMVGLLTNGAPKAAASAAAVTPPSVRVGTVAGTFYPNNNNSGAFDTSQLSTPAFTQSFPVIDFNPPSSAQVKCSNSTGVDENTRPFTDVIPNSDGSCSTLVAAGNGMQAGTGSLNMFEAVFQSTLTVDSPAQVTFNFFSDDGWILGLGQQQRGTAQPTYVSGQLSNAPSTSPVLGYPVVGALNGPSAPTQAQVTVNFPAAGIYPMELDYTECCGGQLALTMGTTAGNPIPSGAGCPAPGGGSSGTPTLNVTVENGNAADTATGSGWAANEEVDIYLDTAAGAHFVGQAFTDSSGSFSTPVPLAPFTGLLPSRHDELAVDPGEVFPVVAMDSSCDAATISYQKSKGQVTSPGLTESTPDGTTLVSNTHATDGGCTQSGVPLEANVPAATTPQFPLVADGRWIVDSSKPTPQRVKLVSVNWYGAEEADFVPGGLQCQNVDTIAAEIATMGFNSVRLPWSNAMYEQGPSTCTSSDLAASFAGANQTCIPPQVLAANPQFLGQDALSIYSDVVDALADHNVMVILDNHGTDASFTPTPFNGIWWGGQLWDDQFGYDQNIDGRTQLWINDWVGMASMFADTPDVIGADLRNEPAPTPYSCGHVFLLFGTHHCTPTWGGGDPRQDWLQAAEDAGNAIINPGVNPNLLIFIEGTDYSLDFTKVHGQPVQLDAANHVVYSPHSYSFDFPDWISYKDLSKELGRKWGYILTQNRPWTAPIWVGEFGASASDIRTGVEGGNFCGITVVPADESWFSCFARYLANADIDWSYWAVNGTEGDGGTLNPNTDVSSNDGGRAFYSTETYGIFDPSWSQNSSLGLIQALQALQSPTQFP